MRKVVRASFTILALGVLSWLGACSDSVDPPASVASVTITPQAATLATDGRLKLTATVREANGNVLTGRRIAWVSQRASVATVDTSGVVTALSEGATMVIAASEIVSDTAMIHVVTMIPCRITPDGIIVC
ncbi:MAG TPA: Ig-like domain-containing protein [Gemmatimonadales bacterium]|nr:Ig-like domain-containing protein [Gemmatimonadales bacterium]